MASPVHKLTYFSIKGRGEPIRQAFFLGGVAFQDNRVTFPEFPALKPSLPLGQLPILEVDGKIVPQATAMLRYAGKQSGLYPTDAMAAMLVDAVIDTVNDVINAFMRTLSLPVGDQLATRNALISPGSPMCVALEGLNKFIAANGDLGYAVGSSLTIADLSITHLVTHVTSGTMDHIPTSFLSRWPLIVQARENVEAHPGIKEFNRKFNVPKVKLTYFDMGGRAECIRLALTLAGVPFEDNRLSFKQFGEMKASIPGGQVPVLEVDGKTYTQSMALLRYAGGLGGTRNSLYPSSSLFQLRLEEHLEAYQDIINLFNTTFGIQEEKARVKARQEMFKGNLGIMIAAVDKRIGDANGCEGFCLGVHGKPSIVDLVWFALLRAVKTGSLDGVAVDAFDKYTYLTAVYTATDNIPEVREYYSK